MPHLVAFVALALAAAPSAFAGAACAAKNHASPEDCVAHCADHWGWPGMAMGSDPWGSVIRPTDQNMTEIINAACGLASSSAAPGSTTAPVNVASTPVATLSSTPVTLSLNTAKTSTVSSSSKVSSLAKVSSASTHSSSSTFSTSSAPSFVESTHAFTSVVFTPKTTSTSAPKPPTFSTTPHTTSTPPPQKSSSSHTTAAATTASSGNSGSGSGSTSGNTTPENEISQYLEFHNTIRAQHGASPLTWNQTLADKGQTWANKCVFKHSGGTLGPFGENLAAGTGSGYGIEQAIQSWTNEVSQYNPSNPVPSHFTQVVWKASTQVGCALTECAGGTIFPSSFGTTQYYVCEYHTQGNVIGEFAQNVQV